MKTHHRIFYDVSSFSINNSCHKVNDHSQARIIKRKRLTEYSQSIVDGDNYQVRVAGQDTAVVRGGGVPVEGLPVQEYKDRVAYSLVPRYSWKT